MNVTTSARPPRVDIPDEVWGTSGALAPYMARMALEHGPIYTFAPSNGPYANREVVYMTGPEANRFVLLSHREHFSHDRGWTPVIGETLGKGLLNMDPPEHTWHRALMNPAFTAAYMAAYLPLMQRIIAQRTADWAERGELNLLDEAREITFDVAAAALIGYQTGPEVDYLRERFYTLIHLPGSYEERWEQTLERQQQVRRELGAKLLELIAVRRRAAAGPRPDDVLGMLVQAHDAQGQALTDEQLLAHVNILLVAGHETTTTLGAWLLYLLAEQPEYGERIDAELAQTLGPTGTLTPETVRGLPVLTNAIKEAGRLQAPVMLLPRGVVREFTFNGYTVPAGAPLYLAVAAGHRLPTVFADPERFDPDRFAPPREEDKKQPYALVTFGGGSRICIGINFAQVEVKALLAHVWPRFRFHTIPQRPVIQYGGIIQFLPDGIHARVTPRV